MATASLPSQSVIDLYVLLQDNTFLIITHASATYCVVLNSGVEFNLS